MSTRLLFEVDFKTILRIADHMERSNSHLVTFRVYEESAAHTNILQLKRAIGLSIGEHQIDGVYLLNGTKCTSTRVDEANYKIVHSATFDIYSIQLIVGKNVTKSLSEALWENSVLSLKNITVFFYERSTNRKVEYVWDLRNLPSS